MRHVVHDKYFLKDVLREIDLYDRKLHHLQNHPAAENDPNRERNIKTSITRRGNLILTARKLMDEGIEYDEASLPVSMLGPGEHRKERILHIIESKPVSDPISAPEPSTEKPGSQVDEEIGQTPFGAAIERLQNQAKTAGMPKVNWKEELIDYKRKRNKIPAA